LLLPTTAHAVQRLVHLRMVQRIMLRQHSRTDSWDTCSQRTTHKWYRMLWFEFSPLELFLEIVLTPWAISAWIFFFVAHVLAIWKHLRLETLVAVVAGWHLLYASVVSQFLYVLLNAAGGMGRWDPFPDALWQLSHSIFTYHLIVGLSLTVLPASRIATNSWPELPSRAVRYLTLSMIINGLAICAISAVLSYALFETTDTTWGPHPWERIGMDEVRILPESDDH